MMLECTNHLECYIHLQIERLLSSDDVTDMNSYSSGEKQM
jgi:hypothetical protein